MNREDIIRMAQEARLNMYVNDLTEKQYIEVLEHFAALVASAEREECANSMAKIVMIPTYTHGALVKLSDVISAIRAMKT